MKVRVESHRAVVIAAVNQNMRRKVYAMGTTLREKLLTEVLVGERTGKWYRKPGGKGMYRASAPGEAPASRTGDLRRSYKVGPLEVTPGRVPVPVVSALEYAADLELDMDRPHLSTALDLAGPDFERILSGDWGI